MERPNNFTNLFLCSSKSVMAHLRKYIGKQLQHNEKSDTSFSKAEDTYYFWSGNKYNHVTENIQTEFCQVIKVSAHLEAISNVTLLNSLCDISGSYASSILTTLSSSDNSNQDLSNKIYQQTNQLTEAMGLCVKDVKSNDALSPLETLRNPSRIISSEYGGGVEKEEFIYTCQCNENYGYENCSPAEPPINSISAGKVYCQTNDQISLSSAEESHIIFIDHAVFGRPKFWSTTDEEFVSKLGFMF